ncbi:uncharacterized protein [Euphorbia lathyris]|uniref:uncharacterized protein isoform X2 n=1 Tax=Euphorbia lathyris TaxID=212925 RepID=UPI0033138B59
MTILLHLNYSLATHTFRLPFTSITIDELRHLSKLGIKRDQNGLITLNMSKFLQVDEPFVLSSQVAQVYYLFLVFDMEAASGNSLAENQVTKGKRGNTRGAKWKKIRDRKGGRVEIDIPPCLRRVVGEHAQQFITETSYMVKQILPLKALKWTDIDYDLREKLMDKVYRMLMRLYRNWRYNLRKIYRKFKTDQERLSNCLDDVDLDDWKWLVEQYWGSSKFRHISEVNTENRNKQGMPACVGTKSVVQTLYEMRNTNDDQDERPEYMKLWEKERKKKNGEWADKAEEAYKKMEELHTAQIEQNEVDNLTIVEVYTQVFGHESSYVRGL